MRREMLRTNSSELKKVHGNRLCSGIMNYFEKFDMIFWAQFFEIPEKMADCFDYSSFSFGSGMTR